jgi:hypothetical protein
MSMQGAPACEICGAHSDYCTLETAMGTRVDCRDLRLQSTDNADVERLRAEIAELHAERDQLRDTIWERSHGDDDA